jgi:Acetyl-CoA dehydrogenase C-terminal like
LCARQHRYRSFAQLQPVRLSGAHGREGLKCKIGGVDSAVLPNATVYHEAGGNVVLAWIWLQQAVAAHGKTGDFYDGKRLAARYFFRYELPKTTAQFDLLDSSDRTTIDLDENWF